MELDTEVLAFLSKEFDGLGADAHLGLGLVLLVHEGTGGRVTGHEDLLPFLQEVQHAGHGAGDLIGGLDLVITFLFVADDGE